MCPADGLLPMCGADMIAIFNLLTSIIDIYTFLLIMSVVLSWLVAFNVVNTQNRVV